MIRRTHRPWGLTPRSKYRAQPCILDGVRFASRREGARYTLLKWMLQAGEIREIRLQPEYRLGCPENVYRADFEVVGKDGTIWTEDVKGFPTPKFKHDVRLWEAYGPHTLVIVTVRGRSWNREEIPGGAAKSRELSQ